MKALINIETLYEDEQYIIINKPSGLLSIPDRHQTEVPSVSKILMEKYGKIFIIHRIDKDTSGVLCFAKDEGTHSYTSQLFEKRQVVKKYLGIIHGHFNEEEGVIEDPIMEHPTVKGKMIIHQKQGKASTTRYRVVETFGIYSLVEYSIQTGRTHQIRVHSANYGHPIVCDPVYGKTDPVYISSMKKNYKLSKDAETEKPILNRLALHASNLEFVTQNETNILVEAQLPKDMQSMLQQCRKWLA